MRLRKFVPLVVLQSDGSTVGFGGNQRRCIGMRVSFMLAGILVR